MSYEKAMRHHRNPRKWKKTQPILCCGYGSAPRENYSARTYALIEVRTWFRERKRDRTPEEQAHRRECIREAISGIRKMANA